jgi:anti-sigma-K factor RskA
MGHEEYKQMLMVHAVSALDQGERRELEVHLQSCADCRSELERWEEQAALLALSTSPLAPSSQLRARILDTIRADVPKEIAPDNQKAKVVPLKRTTFTSMQRWGAIAASLIIVGLVIALAALWKQKNEANQRLAQLSGELQEAREQLARKQELVSIVSTPGARMTELMGTAMAPSARAMVAFDKNGKAVLMAKNLPAAPAGKAYQLWFFANGKPMPGKVFKPASSGEGTLNDQVPAAALAEATFAVTLEPEAGVTSPTGKIYLMVAPKIKTL